MKLIYLDLVPLGRQTVQTEVDDTISLHTVLSGASFRELGLTKEDVYCTVNGRPLTEKPTDVSEGSTVYVSLRVRGGKGGFGSMLRAIGAQIEKTTNREACRDLSGRRMRDVNNEKKLRDWVAKAGEREEEKARAKKERIEKMLKPKHRFDDPEYHKQKAAALDNIDDAVKAGMQKTSAGSKRPASSKSKGPAIKKAALWLDADSDDSDVSSSDSDTEASPVEKKTYAAAVSATSSTSATQVAGTSATVADGSPDVADKPANVAGTAPSSDTSEKAGTSSDDSDGSTSVGAVRDKAGESGSGQEDSEEEEGDSSAVATV